VGSLRNNRIDAFDTFVAEVIPTMLMLSTKMRHCSSTSTH
jgi:hypothetical protein